MRLGGCEAGLTGLPIRKSPVIGQADLHLTHDSYVYTGTQLGISGRRGFAPCVSFIYIGGVYCRVGGGAMGNAGRLKHHGRIAVFTCLDQQWKLREWAGGRGGRWTH